MKPDIEDLVESLRFRIRRRKKKRDRDFENLQFLICLLEHFGSCDKSVYSEIERLQTRELRRFLCEAKLRLRYFFTVLEMKKSCDQSISDIEQLDSIKRQLKARNVNLNPWTEEWKQRFPARCEKLLERILASGAASIAIGHVSDAFERKSSLPALNIPEPCDPKNADSRNVNSAESDALITVKAHAHSRPANTFLDDPNLLEPGESSPADAAESLLSGVPLRLFRRLRQNQRFVSFDTLRADVWKGKMIKRRGIEAAIERLKIALLDTQFTVEQDSERAKLVGIAPYRSARK